MRSILRPYFRFEYQTLSAFAVITLGTVGYHIFEGWRWLDSLYFSVMTATTVGYGDFHPQTDYGKIFTIIYVMASIGVISSFIAATTKKNHERAQGISKSLKR